ncbi:MAG: ATP-dependent 6-phosphofructokinase [Bacillota bacterium]|nr:ATP-dependent 6-phosphofructokinase [Bacillota bacterium]
MTRKIALITGGGDCPGINAFLASVVRRGNSEYGVEFIGVRNAFAGLAADNLDDHLLYLDTAKVIGLENRSSTILESSRFNPFTDENEAKGYPDIILNNLKRLGVDGILGTGGNDTLLSALRFENRGLPTVMAPKSIDNDVSGTDVMIGFRTAIFFGAQAARSTADSARAHRRISLVEVMGRQAGWLALEIGVASGADLITIPERPVNLREFCAQVDQLYKERQYVNLVVAEGTSISCSDPVILKAQQESAVVKSLLEETPEVDTFGNPKLGGISQILRRVLRIELGLKKIEEVRTTDLGFTLRGLAPVADDIILGTRFGIRAADILLGENRSGVMVGIRGLEIADVPYEDALKPKTVNRSDRELKALGVFISSTCHPTNKS